MVDESKAKGGFARAEKLTVEERKRIAREGARARWDANVPHAAHEGVVNVGKAQIGAAVLPNSKRLLTQASFLRALGRSRSPKAGTGVLSTAAGLPFFLQAEARYLEEEKEKEKGVRKSVGEGVRDGEGESESRFSRMN